MKQDIELFENESRKKLMLQNFNINKELDDAMIAFVNNPTKENARRLDETQRTVSFSYDFNDFDKRLWHLLRFIGDDTNKQKYFGLKWVSDQIFEIKKKKNSLMLWV